MRSEKSSQSSASARCMQKPIKYTQLSDCVLCVPNWKWSKHHPHISLSEWGQTFVYTYIVYIYNAITDESCYGLMCCFLWFRVKSMAENQAIDHDQCYIIFKVTNNKTQLTLNTTKPIEYFKINNKLYNFIF